MGDREKVYIGEAFEREQYIFGKNMRVFSDAISEHTGKKYVALVNSGTSAIHLALHILGIENGDEVICQTNTFTATANPVKYLGATPVFVDSEKETWNMDPELLETAIQDRIKKGKKPKAVLPVHLYGMPAKMKEISEICSRYEIPIVEDAAESLGSKIENQYCGSFGVFSIVSFNANKIITTSGGGALLADDKMTIKKARNLATQARDTAPWYQHSEIGYNYRMSNIVAGIGRGQMEVLDERIAKRRENFDFYCKELDIGTDPNSDAKITTIAEPEGYFSNRWLTTILIHPENNNGKTWRDVYEHCKTRNIETRPLWKPMHLQPVFKDAPAYTNGVSDELFEKGLCLPSGSNLTDEDRNRVVTAISEILF